MTQKRIFKVKNRRWLKFAKLFFLGLISMGIVFLAIFIYYAKDLPRPEIFEERQLAQPTKIYDRTGEILLYTIYGEEKREIVKLEEFPKNLINAMLATEDSNFYRHHGIDVGGIIRAVMINLKLRKTTHGGSTISQQLIRSTFLTREKTARRKFREIILTLELERRYSKDKILEWYLNQISFGPNIYGAQEAAKGFFNKSVKDLSLAETAVLAATIKAPSYYYPFGDHLENLLARKDYVLKRMLEESLISEEEFQEAKDQELKFTKAPTTIKAPHFVLHVRGYLLEKYGEEFLRETGLKVHTSLDWELQEKTQAIVEEEAERIKNYYNANNVSVVIINPNTGEILTMIGSKDFFGSPSPEGCSPGLDCLFEPEVNVATYGVGQQPGSAFKPFVYATAFKKGYTENTVVVDELTDFGRWGEKSYIPKNYDGLFRGPVTLRRALAQSLNVPSVKVLFLAGIEDSIKTAKDFGITTLNQAASFYGPSLVLGGGEVKLLDMVSAYGVFAADGLRNTPISVLKIEDAQGNILEESKGIPKRVASVEVCEVVNDILSDNNARAPMFGKNSPLYFPNHWVVAKTGTTDSYRDAWTIGYTKSIVIGVWAGNNNNDPMRKAPAVSITGPIWHRLMSNNLSPIENYKNEEKYEEDNSLIE